MSSIIDILVTHLFGGRIVEHAWSEHSLVVNLLIIYIDRSQLLIGLLWNILILCRLCLLEASFICYHEVLLHEVVLLNLAVLLIQANWKRLCLFRMILRFHPLHLCIHLHLQGLLLEMN